MRSGDLKEDLGRATRAGITALSLIAVAAPGAIIFSGHDAYAHAGSKAKARAGDLGIFGSLFGKGTTGSSGHGAFAMDPAGVRASFDSLTKPQQARVIQRCRDVVAKPAQFDPNQLALCQTVIATAKR